MRISAWSCLPLLVGTAGSLPPLAVPLDPPQRRGVLATEKPLYSHAKEELVIRDFFHDQRGGFFLDVGCGHPLQDSNTYYLEKHLGWSGIAVDGLPEFARKWRRNRPASKFFNFLVTDHTGTSEPFFRAELRDISAAEKPMRLIDGRPLKFEEIQVPTITLTRLLEQNRASKIDFLSIDIEGFEPQALAGFDIERFRPRLACIEAKPKSREKILKYFADHGYARIERYLAYDVMNYYFTPSVPGR